MNVLHYTASRCTIAPSHHTNTESRFCSALGGLWSDACVGCRIAVAYNKRKMCHRTQLLRLTLSRQSLRLSAMFLSTLDGKTHKALTDKAVSNSLMRNLQ